MSYTKKMLAALSIFAIAAITPATAFAPNGLKATAGLPAHAVAQKNFSSPRAGYTCSGLQCTCTGDADCNDMFESGKCGDVASCEETTGVCKCLMLKNKGPKVKAPPSGVKSPSSTKQN